MTLSAEQTAILLELLGRMNTGHISTLIACLDEPNSQIGTSGDSASHAFLQQLCQWGLARELPLEVDLPPDLRANLTSFSINEEAKAEIAQFLSSKPIDGD